MDIESNWLLDIYWNILNFRGYFDENWSFWRPKSKNSHNDAAQPYTWNHRITQERRVPDKTKDRNRRTINQERQLKLIIIIEKKSVSIILCASVPFAFVPKNLFYTKKKDDIRIKPKGFKLLIWICNSQCVPLFLI